MALSGALFCARTVYRFLKGADSPPWCARNRVVKRVSVGVTSGFRSPKLQQEFAIFGYPLWFSGSCFSHPAIEHVLPRPFKRHRHAARAGLHQRASPPPDRVAADGRCRPPTWRYIGCGRDGDAHRRLAQRGWIVCAVAAHADDVPGGLQRFGWIALSACSVLDWLLEPELRRRVTAVVCLRNRLGEIRDRTFAAKRHRASGPNLVTAAIILWNTVYFGLLRRARY
jgi:hypothetical protein